MNKNVIRNIILTSIVIIAIIIIAIIIKKAIDSNVLIITKNYYTNEDFDIEKYISSVDKDGDGIDDQTDFFQSANKYLGTKPKYKSEYYPGGYPDGEYGVCTDVITYGALGAGYDLMELVNDDIIANPERYDIENVDKNIDFRRVKNLKPYLDYNAISLTTDLYNIKEWQAGDIVVFKTHIGMISDKRNEKGVPFLIHHANPFQIHYEENVLELYVNEIVGHYRLS